NPWLRNTYYRDHYRSYRGRYQPVIRDSRDNRYYAERERYNHERYNDRRQDRREDRRYDGWHNNEGNHSRDNGRGHGRGHDDHDRH
ncbi:MAG: hypothetical protein ACRDE5_12740, partial [Ginsengibacter sp.]